jgi:hypothetical protein
VGKKWDAGEYTFPSFPSLSPRGFYGAPEYMEENIGKLLPIHQSIAPAPSHTHTFYNSQASGLNNQIIFE